METKKFVAKTFITKPSKFGTGMHIIIDKEFENDEIEVRILKEARLCKRCSGIFTNKKDFSQDSRYCKACFKALKFLEKNKDKLKCKVCKKKITAKEYQQAWNTPICEECWIGEVEKE
jgi:hypothetical protein